MRAKAAVSTSCFGRLRIWWLGLGSVTVCDRMARPVLEETARQLMRDSDWIGFAVHFAKAYRRARARGRGRNEGIRTTHFNYVYLSFQLENR